MGDFSSLWEHIANDFIENASKVGDGGGRQRYKNDRLYDVVAQPVQNLAQIWHP